MKKFINNKNGFTLVELLVVMVILGIITLMSYPVIRNISNKNENSKFEKYRDTLITSAKLYVSDNAEDLFGTKESDVQCVTFKQLSKRGLVKDIEISNYSCDNDNTFVKIEKNNNKYTYEAYLYCKSGDSSVIFPKNDTPYNKNDFCSD